jgi:hypothetical protein
MQRGDAFAQRIKGGLRAVRQVKFAENTADVIANGPLAKDEALGDLLICQPLRHQLQNI